MRESKECAECGGIYFRAEGATGAMWEARRYCSPSCAGKAAQKRLRAKKEERAGEEWEFRIQKEGELVKAETLEDFATTGVLTKREPVMRELRVIRIGPNPKTITCEYYELASRRTCVVLVKKNNLFTKGMKFQMAEPVSEAAFQRPWIYTGPPPRRKGKW